MPLTFIDIERRTTWRIWVFFLFLLVLYFVVCLAFSVPFMGHAIFLFSHYWPAVFLIAFVVAGVHFLFAGYNAVHDSVVRLDARPPDPTDAVHAMLLNIMQEIHVVIGNKRKIHCVVVPTLSLNALAAADLKGEAVIAITEGLLSRLTRPQLETVIAHEASHILSGDCLETTIATSLFGSLSSLLDGMRYDLPEPARGLSFLHPMMLPAWIALTLSSLLNMFISREREYRADAAAVRMTRNPVALAETLYLLSRSWRGAGFIGSGFEMMCIVNPQAKALDETEGFLADLLATHPPIRKRIERLLGMAHVSIGELDRRAEREKTGAIRPVPSETYYAVDPRQQMQGPFTLSELGALPWLSPLTWISTAQQQPVERAWKDPRVNAIFAARLGENASPLSDFTCPVCRQQLIVEHYEGTQVFQCRFCSGTLVENDKIPRILARTGSETPCTDRIQSLARAMMKQNQQKNASQRLSDLQDRRTVPHLSCPKCGNPMYRGFFSAAYVIEIDRCSFCGITWFDKDELAMLQCLVGNKIGQSNSQAISN